jgi:hypothetical protein
MIERILRLIKGLLAILFWLTPWGKAVVQLAWKMYKESELFTLRTKDFGTNMAAELLTHNEFRLFLSKALKKHRFDAKLIFTPYTIYDVLKGRDAILKSLVNLDK